MPNTPICQSCGMHMEEAAHFGKNADGSKNEDYCCYCHPEGSFAETNQTMEGMIEEVAPMMVEDGSATTLEEAKAKLEESFPTLKRWKRAYILKKQAERGEVYPLVVPRILLNGKTELALELYQQAFGATISDKKSFKEAHPADFSYSGAEKDNLIYYSELMIGKHMVMVSDDSKGLLGENSGKRPLINALCVSFESEEKAQAAYDVLVVGGKVIMPITSVTFGTFYATIADKFGVIWDLYFGTP